MEYASKPLLASRSFIGALEKIPSIIEKYEKENEKISKDIPVLQEVANSVWRKENELKNLKTELDALSRKIQLSLKPVEQGDEKPENRSQKNNIAANSQTARYLKNCSRQKKRWAIGLLSAVFRNIIMKLNQKKLDYDLHGT
jgi:hypothetical protein